MFFRLFKSPNFINDIGTCKQNLAVSSIAFGGHSKNLNYFFVMKKKNNRFVVISKNMDSSELEMKSDGTLPEFHFNLGMRINQVVPLELGMVEMRIVFQISHNTGRSVGTVEMYSIVTLIIDDTLGVLAEDPTDDRCVRLVADEFKEVGERMIIDLNQKLIKIDGWGIVGKFRIGKSESFAICKPIIEEFFARS